MLKNGKWLILAISKKCTGAIFSSHYRLRAEIELVSETLCSLRILEDGQSHNPTNTDFKNKVLRKKINF